jgi:hypothetical protein
MNRYRIIDALWFVGALAAVGFFLATLARAELIPINGEWHPVHNPAPIRAVRSTVEGVRDSWPITGGKKGPPYGVQFEHGPVSEGNVGGIVEVWWDGRDNSLYIHNMNGHDWQPVWRGGNFMQVKLVDRKDD